MWLYSKWFCKMFGFKTSLENWNTYSIKCSAKILKSERHIVKNALQLLVLILWSVDALNNVEMQTCSLKMEDQASCVSSLECYCLEYFKQELCLWPSCKNWCKKPGCLVSNIELLQKIILESLQDEMNNYCGPLSGKIFLSKTNFQLVIWTDYIDILSKPPEC